MTNVQGVIGRPSKGKALTSTQRSAKRDRALLDAGGRIVRSLRLSPEAAHALTELASLHGSDRHAIEAALLGWQRLSSEFHDRHLGEGR
ncbi:hypothetical protein D7S55_18010 [Ralstonia pickettii]|nr:hypothetical protein [Ralstonia pickettii]MBA9852022.1 hypothetical protein [Ralstonia pickettii]MBA9919963.1 hypothetical protein [Ralstonia pickettii]MBA9959065.1 hypothetical protein [Ralstonia pickettii]MBA9964557.1 hypothetical protein [Ralstonia pickettii]